MLHGTERIVKHKLGLLNLAEELSNVSRACKIMGVSRDTFYRYKAAVENGGVEALIDKNRRKPNLKNRVEEKTEAAVVAYATEQPAHVQVRASNELRKLVIRLRRHGFPNKETAALVGISVAHASKIWIKYLRGDIDAIKPGTRDPRQGAQWVLDAHTSLPPHGYPGREGRARRRQSIPERPAHYRAPAFRLPGMQYIKGFEQLLGSIEKGRRIVVARDNDNMPTR